MATEDEELDSFVSDYHNKRREQAKRADMDEQTADKVDARRRGLTDEQHEQDKADEAEKDRLRRLGVRVDG